MDYPEHLLIKFRAWGAKGGRTRARRLTRARRREIARQARAARKK